MEFSHQIFADTFPIPKTFKTISKRATSWYLTDLFTHLVLIFFLMKFYSYLKKTEAAGFHLRSLKRSEKKTPNISTQRRAMLKAGRAGPVAKWWYNIRQCISAADSTASYAQSDCPLEAKMVLNHDSSGFKSIFIQLGHSNKCSTIQERQLIPGNAMLLFESLVSLQKVPLH